MRPRRPVLSMPARQRLVKLALAVGARSQGAVHSHARRALREGVPAAALLQVPLLAVSSVGWSAAMAALAWGARRDRRPGLVNGVRSTRRHRPAHVAHR